MEVYGGFGGGGDGFKEEIEEQIVQNLSEVKLDDCKSQDFIILVGGCLSNVIDFIRFERFNWIIDSYLVNFINCMKTK